MWFKSVAENRLSGQFIAHLRCIDNLSVDSYLLSISEVLLCVFECPKSKASGNHKNQNLERFERQQLQTRSSESESNRQANSRQDSRKHEHYNHANSS